MRLSATLSGVLLLLLSACVVPESSAGANLLSQEPATATPAPPGLAPTHNALQPLSLPTASPAERQGASDTWLYLSTFQSFNVSVIDPLSGHTLHAIPTAGDRAGVAVAPDGSRLYVLDGLPDEEQLRVLDTTTWQVVHQEPVAKLARTFINPVIRTQDSGIRESGIGESGTKVAFLSPESRFPES
jgi:DNA-binding beta-propeller fold protein YncE